MFPRTWAAMLPVRKEEPNVELGKEAGYGARSSQLFCIRTTLLRKFAYAINALLLLLLVHIVIAGRNSSITQHIFRESDSKDDGLNAVLGPQTERQSGFIIMTPTYKRAQMLPAFLDHYANGTIPSLRQILILWHDEEEDPPDDLINSFDTYPVPIILERRAQPLNERFRSSKNVWTNCVLSLDDDLVFAPEDIEFGYQTWKELGLGRKRMVGYIAREVNANQEYLMWNIHHRYSMVLTKASFFHADWLDAYWNADPTLASLRDYVAEHRNCEDILMSFINARATHMQPLAIRAPFRDGGLSNGISQSQQHGRARTECVRHFAKAFGGETLTSSELQISRFG